MKVSGTAYNGGQLDLGKRYPVVIKLAGVEVHGGGDKVPLLSDHQIDKPVGHATATIGAKSLDIVDGVLSQQNEHSEAIQASASQGFPWQASIGGKVRSPYRLLARGKSENINGRVFRGPLLVVDRFTWRETSIVAIGADSDRASLNIAAKHKARNMEPEYIEWLEAMGFSADDLSEDQSASLHAKWEAEADSSADVADVSADLAKKRLADELGEIQATAFKIGRVAEKYKSRVPAAKLDDLHAQASAGDITVEGFELELLRLSRPMSRPGSGGSSSSSVDPDAITAALSRAAGINEDVIEAHLKDEVGPKQAERALEASWKLNSYGLHRLCFDTLSAHGHTAPQSRLDDDVLHAALKANAGPGELQASAGQFSTLSVPGILSRVANKAMLQAYGEHSGVGLQFACTTETNDMKELERFRMTEAGLMEEIPEHGEIPLSTLGEEKHVNKVKTHGRMFGIGEETFINDDLGAMLQIPKLLGRMGAHTLETAIIQELIDQSTGTTAAEFFTTANTKKVKPNYMTGATTALDIDSLGSAYEMFLNQVDQDGKPIMVNPALLLVTTKNAINAGKLYKDASYRFTAADTKETIGNQWQGLFSPLVSPHLGSLVPDGGAANADQWYLLPNPSDTAVVNVAFLRGQKVPTIRQAEADFNRLGVQMRGVFRFGVNAWDRRLAVKSNGKA